MQPSLALALPLCPGLRAFSIELSSKGRLTSQLLTAVAALLQLRQLRLSNSEGHSDTSMLPLLAACRQLQQLTLVQVESVTADLVAALVAAAPQLRLGRLLCCPGAPSQAQCQALLGQWQRHDLQLDVVPDDDGMSARICWAMRELAGQWDKALQ